MNIGIVGLGLIGGSIAKAYKVEEGFTVYAYDIDKAILDFAIMSDAVDYILNTKTIKDCDYIYIALYPEATIQWLEENAPHISSHTLVMDTCGIKRSVCEKGFMLSQIHGFTFVGGHPMAGKQYSGFKNSSANLFNDAYMIVVPDSTDNIVALERIKKAIAPMKFRHITITDADVHDQMIAFTSQMAHLVSNAFIKSPTAKEHKGFSAGSYKDLTRVAYLNEIMWTELFMSNSDNLLAELDFLIDHLNQYKEALAHKDSNLLLTLLAKGKESKKEVDGL